MSNKDSYHIQYSEAKDGWDLVLDIINIGGRRIKEDRARHLHKPSGMTEEEFQKYAEAGNFFNATRTTATSMLGMLIRKPATVEVSFNEDYLNDIDLKGNSLNDYTKQVLATTSTTGRGCSVIEYNAEEARPYLAFYTELEILDWHEERRNGRMMLTYLKLVETCHDFDRETRMTAASERVREYVLSETEGLQILVDNEEQPLPEFRGTAVQFIPVVFHGTSDQCAEVGTIPLEDMAQINLSHYRSSVDLEQCRHLFAMPMLFASGVDSDVEIQLGNSTAFVTENENADVKFIEFEGQGVTPLSDALTEKEQQMSALGARLLYNKTSNGEALETVQLRAGAETASLVTIVDNASKSLSMALSMFAWWDQTNKNLTWQDFKETNTVELSKDFVSVSLDPAKLQALTAAHLSGAISFETYFYNLSKGETYPDDVDMDTEKRLAKEGLEMPIPTNPAE